MKTSDIIGKGYIMVAPNFKVDIDMKCEQCGKDIGMYCYTSKDIVKGRVSLECDRCGRITVFPIFEALSEAVEMS